MAAEGLGAAVESERDRLLRLGAQRDHLEAEIARYGQVLRTNGVGMNERLTDENDFPRADIDVYQVRHARHQIICLQNDHKALMKEIEEGLYRLHSHHRPNEHVENGHSSHIALHMNGHDPVAASNLANGSIQKCIAQVNFICPGSPADTAGIKVGDDIIEFGSVNANNFKALAQIADVVQHSVNVGVNVKIMRGLNNEIVDVTLIPRTWSGRGLLGCNIILHPDFS